MFELSRDYQRAFELIKKGDRHMYTSEKVENLTSECSQCGELTEAESSSYDFFEDCIICDDCDSHVEILDPDCTEDYPETCGGFEEVETEKIVFEDLSAKAIAKST